MTELIAKKPDELLSGRPSGIDTTDATKTVLLAATIVFGLTLSLTFYTGVLLFVAANPGSGRSC
ncbi:hypothetical protein [Arthrobacter polaris]|uniref:hypothetical protein n=1 Tax=Arthrobacter polaris TaxID=2813727 RepID=UPI001F2DF3DB|nr:hypothetical protein [Arthrobacter polaris]UIK88460.1 hypothetical protein J0916_13985 [Arthrobacter polaris]